MSEHAPAAAMVTAVVTGLPLVVLLAAFALYLGFLCFVVIGRKGRDGALNDVPEALRAFPGFFTRRAGRKPSDASELELAGEPPTLHIRRKRVARQP